MGKPSETQEYWYPGRGPYPTKNCVLKKEEIQCSQVNQVSISSSRNRIPKFHVHTWLPRIKLHFPGLVAAKGYDCGYDYVLANHMEEVMLVPSSSFFFFQEMMSFSSSFFSTLTGYRYVDKSWMSLWYIEKAWQPDKKIQNPWHYGADALWHQL